jgi:phosphate:Na+ symporter
MLAGALLTAVIQSSSASVGILQALCASGAVSYGAAIPIIMGQNIGTCVTALLSSIGAKKNAKRTAFVHLYFNLIGTIVFMAVFYAVNRVVPFEFLADAAGATGIAAVHTVFNVAATLLWLPFHTVLVRLAELTIRDGKQEERTDGALECLQALDDRFLSNPALAIEQCRTACARMAAITKKTMQMAIAQLEYYDAAQCDLVRENEDIIDQYEDRLGTYLIQIAHSELQSRDSHTLSVLLHSIGDLERISDHAVAIVHAAQEVQEKRLSFSDSARSELRVISRAVTEIVFLTMDALKSWNLRLAEEVEPLEEVIDEIGDTIKKRHIDRLRDGTCTMELGFILSDLLTSYKRVADHCSNISVCLIQAEHDEFGRHAYLNSLKEQDNRQFQKFFQIFRERYQLDV